MRFGIKIMIVLAAELFFAMAVGCGSAESDSAEIKTETESETKTRSETRDSVIVGDMEDQVVTLACSADLPPVYHEAAALFAGEVNRATDGRIAVEIKLIGDSADDSLPLASELVADGSVPFALVSLADISERDASVREWLGSLYPDHYEGTFRAVHAGDLEFLNENFIYVYNSVLLSVCGGNVRRSEGEGEGAFDPYDDIQLLIVNNDYWNGCFDELKNVFRNAAGTAADSTE